MLLPSGLNAAEITPPVCPARVRSFCPVAASQTMAVLSIRRGDDLPAVRAERRQQRSPCVPGEGAEFLPGGRVPDDGGLVQRGGDDLLPSGLNAAELTCPCARRGCGASARWPRPRRWRSCPHEAVTMLLAVRAECRRQRHQPVCPASDAELLPGGRVPDDGGLVHRGGDDPLTVRAERRDTSEVPCVRRACGPSARWPRPRRWRSRPHEAVTMLPPSGLNAARHHRGPVCPARAELLPGGRVPDDGGAVRRGSDDPPAVRAERRRHHSGRVPGEGAELLPGGRVPDDGGLVPRRGDDAPPSGLNAAASQGPCARRAMRSFCPVAASQTMAVLSSEAVTIRRPSGLNAADHTGFVCPVSERIFRPVAAFQTMAVPSPEAVTIRRPSALNAAHDHRFRVSGERCGASARWPRPRRWRCRPPRR